MLKKILLGVLGLLALAIVLAAVGLTWAHVAINRERAPLPTPAAIVASVTSDGPIRVRYINTASQPMPRSGVLDPGQDPHPNEAYVMSHPSFVLEWADGRILLVDAGMTRQGAIDFGGPIEMFTGAQPIQPLGSAAERLGAARSRVQATIFTHLHLDHVGGISELCNGLDHPLHVFQTEAQALRPNYTTRPGLKLLHNSSCVQLQQLSGGPLLAVPGFPGVFVIAAGGHTPGSQLVVAHLRGNETTRTLIFLGDIVNNIDGVTYNVPKPYLYRLLAVPEDDMRTDELRRYLRDLRDQHGVQVIPAHDQHAIEASGIEAIL
jgi:glyoxylase-like metal-dependent hydrolase (beta-lactamase superfamily II)